MWVCVGILIEFEIPLFPVIIVHTKKKITARSRPDNREIRIKGGRIREVELYCVFCNTPVTLIRNQQESSRTSWNEEFSKFAPHSGGNFKPSHVSLEAEWAGMEILYIFLDMQFGGVLNYVRTHSRANRDVPTEFQRHLNCIPAEFVKYRNRFRQQSRCIRGAFRLIWGAFGTFWQDLKWLAVLILLRRRSECFECCWNAVTARKKNAVRVQFECCSIFFHFESTSNVWS